MYEIIVSTIYLFLVYLNRKNRIFCILNMIFFTIYAIALLFNAQTSVESTYYILLIIVNIVMSLEMFNISIKTDDDE